MNIRDSEAVSSILLNAGYQQTNDIEDANIIMINTCSVRDSAEKKAEGYLWKLRDWKEAGHDRILCIIGCMAQSEGNKLLDKFPHLDIVVGTAAISRLPELIENVSLGYGRFSETNLNSIPYDDANTHLYKNKISAFIPVMRGCSMHCSYCIVPQVRGTEISRPIEEIIGEARLLVENGVKEIFLLGQNIAAYGQNGDKSKRPLFAELLAKIAEINELKRIRFTSPHPANFNDDLIKVVCETPKICSSIHIPIQSGSNKILKKMKRGYTLEDYMRIINKLKEGRPELCFSTDVIVGFPGEEEDDFYLTRNVLNSVDFDQEFIFKYSKRKDTPAAEMIEQVPQKIKEERNKILLDDLKKRVIKKNKNLIGTEQEILIESESPRQNKRFIGKTSSNKTVIVEKKENFAIGSFAIAVIEDCTMAALYGRLK